MAILTVSEQADMLKRLATNVMDHGTAQLYPAYAQAILDVLAALEVVTAERDEFSSLLAANVVVRAAQKLELDGVTAERDALAAKLGAVPMDAIREAQRFCATAFHPTANLDVMLGEWWKPFTSWLETEVTP